MYLEVKEHKTYSIRSYFLSCWASERAAESNTNTILIFFSGGCIIVWSIIVCVMHAKIIVNKSLMTEGVKNRLFLVLPTVQDFSA